MKIYGNGLKIHLIFTWTLATLSILLFILTSSSIENILYFAVGFLVLSIIFGYYTYRMYIQKTPILEISNDEIIIKTLFRLKTISSIDIEDVEIIDAKKTSFLVIYWISD